MSPRVPCLAFVTLTLATAAGCASQPCSPTFPCNDEGGTTVVVVERSHHHHADPVLAAATLFTAAAVVAATASSGSSSNPQAEWTTEEGPGDDPTPPDEPPLRVRVGPIPPHEQPSAADTRVESRTAFDLGGAYSALAQVDLTPCKAQGLAAGYGRVEIAFANAGTPASLNVSLPAGSSASAQACVDDAFKRVQVARFDGSRATVRRSFFVQG
jgi:hypothetical protein